MLFQPNKSENSFSPRRSKSSMAMPMVGSLGRNSLSGKKRLTLKIIASTTSFVQLALIKYLHYLDFGCLVILLLCIVCVVSMSGF